MGHYEWYYIGKYERYTQKNNLAIRSWNIDLHHKTAYTYPSLPLATSFPRYLWLHLSLLLMSAWHQNSVSYQTGRNLYPSQPISLQSMALCGVKKHVY